MTSLPLINGPGRGRGAGPMPPTLLQGPLVYTGNTGGRQPYSDGGYMAAGNGTALPSLVGGVTADLRSQGMYGAGPEAAPGPQPDGCARCRLWDGPVRLACGRTGVTLSDAACRSPMHASSPPSPRPYTVQQRATSRAQHGVPGHVPAAAVGAWEEAATAVKLRSVQRSGHRQRRRHAEQLARLARLAGYAARRAEAAGARLLTCACSCLHCHTGAG